MIVIFDVETQKLANEVGGWHNIDKMQVSLAVAYVGHRGFLTYREQDVPELIELLMSADLVVGYNHIGFDYKVLSRYTDIDLASQTTNLDICTAVHKALGHRVKLDDVASATLGIGKSAEGVQAVKWFRERKWDSLEEYCRQDVRVTRDVLMHGINFGKVYWRKEKMIKPKTITIPVHWDWVKEKADRPGRLRLKGQQNMFGEQID